VIFTTYFFKLLASVFTLSLITGPNTVCCYDYTKYTVRQYTNTNKKFDFI